MHENSGTHFIVLRRARYPRHMVDREKLSLPSGSAFPDYPNGGRGCPKPGYRQRASNFKADRPTLAAEILISSSPRFGKRCPPSRTQATHSPEKNQCHYRGHASNNTAQCNTLEHSQHGQISGRQQSDGVQDMATAQSQTASCRNIQAQSRQAIRRETSRCRWPLSQPAGQGVGPMRRRKEPDPSSRSDTTFTPLASRHSGASDARLHTTRNNNFVCRSKYARWQGYWRLYAPASASGIYPFLATHKRQDPAGFGPASHCRQLWHPQTPAGLEVAQSTPSISPSLYPNIQFVAQHGRTLVPGDYRQTYSTRFVQERSRPDRRDYEISRESQPKPACLYLERIG